MKPPSNPDLLGLAYNAEVRKVYFKLLRDAKALLCTIEEEPLRYTLIREDRRPVKQGTIVHELVSPLLYLRLECYANNQLGIHYGWELLPAFSKYYPLASKFIHRLYKLTMVEATPVNIEDCIRTDYVINDCSALYEYIEERGCKHHTFTLIPHKPQAIKRKLRKVA